MIIYNVTISIEKGVEQEVLAWLKESHIPEVMDTRKFLEVKMFKILDTPNQDLYNSFAIQYTLDNWEEFEDYQQKHASRLQQKTKDKFGDKVLAYRTFLESIYP